MKPPITAALLPHPSTPCTAVRAIEVAVSSTDIGALRLDYRIDGEIDRLHWPVADGPAQRADGLWKTTCCEVFMAATDHGAAYREFNFSPAGHWAGYAFSAPRMRDPEHDPTATAAPVIHFERDAHSARLSVVLPASAFAQTAGQGLTLGLCAVIELNDGSLSYWALQHLGAQPDFHLRDSFSLALDLAR